MVSELNSENIANPQNVATPYSTLQLFHNPGVDRTRYIAFSSLKTGVLEILEILKSNATPLIQTWGVSKSYPCFEGDV